MSDKSVNKYLRQYAEPEVNALQEFPDACYDSVVLIPVYQESPDFITDFLSRFKDKPTLFVLVINQPEDDFDAVPQTAITEFVERIGQMSWYKDNLSLYTFNDSHVKILLVERYQYGNRIPKKQGVGLARKIAADIAVYLIQRGAVKNPQIYSTDADATLPDNYFADSLLKRGSCAGVFNFSHKASGNQDIDAATSLYEQRLHYYVDGLAFAGSKYAFHTIGSCLTFTMQAYCQVRGFPKKSAGEDFYLLNKLAKLAEVQCLAPVIHLRSRLSDRVPFGTGPAVSQIIDLQHNNASYPIYHPETFVRLKILLTALQNTVNKDIQVERLAEHLDVTSYDFLLQSRFLQQYQKWQVQFSDPDRLQHAVDEWFDAFRILKFVHFQRDNGLADIAIDQAQTLKNALWI